MISHESKNNRVHNRAGYSQVFSGAGIGSLVGLLIGLSLSPVVGTVISGLVAVLAAFLGLASPSLPVPIKNEPSAEAVDRDPRVRELRTGSFAIACAVTVLLGLFIRTHNLLGVGLEEQYKQWKTIGFEDKAARQLLAYKELGLVPDGFTATKEKSGPRADLSVLYASRQEVCRDLAPEQYQSADETLNAWTLHGKAWKEVAEIVKAKAPAKEQAAMVRAIWRVTCQSENE